LLNSYKWLAFDLADVSGIGSSIYYMDVFSLADVQNKWLMC